MYDLRPTAPSPEHLARLSAFLRFVFPHARCFAGDYLEWMYFRNPEGRVTGFEGYAGGEIVGHFAIIPTRMLDGGVERPAGLAVNIAIHPEHRGHGLFAALTAITHETFEATGREVVVGVANAQSTERFVRRLGYRLIGPLIARIGLAGAVSDPRTDGRVRLRRLWTPESFAWRFSNPSWTYRFRREGSVVRVLTPTQRLGIEAELGVFPADWVPPAQQRRYPRFTHPLRVWLGLRPGGASHWPLSVPIPRALRPSPLNMILKDTRRGAETPGSDQVDMRGADFDPY